MKSFSIILLILGIALLVYSIKGASTMLIMTDEHKLAVIKYEISKGLYSTTVNLSEECSKRESNAQTRFFIIFGISITFLTIGFLSLKNVYRLHFSIKTMGVQLLYWLFFVLIVGLIFSSGGAYFSDCTVTWMYLFLTSALVGFYSGYYILYPYFSVYTNTFLRWLSIAFTSILGGFVAAYPLQVITAVHLKNISLLNINIEFLAFICMLSFSTFIHCVISMLLIHYKPRFWFAS